VIPLASSIINLEQYEAGAFRDEHGIQYRNARL
jgi:hypothetical protein